MIHPRLFFVLMGLALMGIGGYALMYLQCTNYEDFIVWYAGISDVQHMHWLREALPSSKFPWVRFGPIFIMILGVVLSGFSSRMVSATRMLGEYLGSMIQYFLDLPRAVMYSFLFFWVILSGMCVYDVMTMPIYYDEAWTFQNFTERTFLSSVSYYPAPNNHVLHSLFTNISYSFPFSTTTNLRIPNLIVYFLSLILVFYTFSRLLSARAALVAMVVFGTLFSTLFYGYLSRGYMLIVLAFVLTFYAVMRLTYFRHSEDSKYFMLLTASAIIGFYAIPSYLYAYFTAVSFLGLHMMIARRRDGFWRLVISGMVTIAVVLLLYTPVLLISGIDSLTANDFVKPMSRAEVVQKMPAHLSGICSMVFGMNTPPVLVILGLTIFGLRGQSEKWFSLFCLLWVPVILVLHSLIPFSRTWIYLVVPFCYMIAMLWSRVPALGRLQTYWVAAILMVLAGFQYWEFLNRVPSHDRSSYWGREISDELMNHDAQSLYVTEGTVLTNILYALNDVDHEIKLYIDYENQGWAAGLLSQYDYAMTYAPVPDSLGFEQVYDFGQFIYLSKNLRNSR